MGATAPGTTAAEFDGNGSGGQALARMSLSVASLNNEVQLLRHAQALRTIARRKTKADYVLFFGRPSFSDNSKYLFLHAASRSAAEIGFTPIWCTSNAGLATEINNHGLRAFHLGQDPNKTIQLLLAAPVAVFCTNPREALQQPLYAAALGGTFHLQLWHGVGTKRLDLMLTDQSNLLNWNALESLQAASSVDAVLSPSAWYDHVWREAFGAHRVLRGGLPRNEVLLRLATTWEQIGSVALPPGDGLPKVLFAPTFTYAGQTPAWSSPETLEKIRDGLPKKKGYIFVKPHPFDQGLAIKSPRIDGAQTIPSDVDIYPVLRSFDLLVTDKSSLLTDFLLTDKPIVVLKESNTSVNEEKSDENPYAKVEPGLSATLADIPSAIRQALTNDVMQSNRACLRQMIFETDPLSACSTLTRILSAIVAKRLERQRKSTPLEPSLLLRNPQEPAQNRTVDEVLPVLNFDRNEVLA